MTKYRSPAAPRAGRRGPGRVHRVPLRALPAHRRSDLRQLLRRQRDGQLRGGLQELRTGPSSACRWRRAASSGRRSCCCSPAYGMRAPRSEAAGRVAGYVFLLSMVGLAAVFYFGYASFFVLEKACLLCIAVYVSVIGIFIVSSAVAPAKLGSLLAGAGRDVSGLMSQPRRDGAGRRVAARLDRARGPLPARGDSASPAPRRGRRADRDARSRRSSRNGTSGSTRSRACPRRCPPAA